jgi:endonuclease/exonuclease/phosphatase family metal-dependent hydrolase
MTLDLRIFARSLRCSCRLLPVLLAFGGLPAVATAQTTVVLDASGTEVSADTTIRAGGYASVNYGTSDTLQVKSDADSSYRRRILLKFDTQNYLPAGAVINSAQLSLTLKGADDSTLRPIGVYRVAKSFLGRQATWLDYRDALSWSNPGGDLGGRYTTTNVGNAVGSAYKFDLTELVQQTVNGTFGSRYTRLVLVDTGAGSSKALRSFYSSRSSNTALRPKLVITYGSQPGSQPAPLSSTTSTTLKVMQWNIHGTCGSDSGCSPTRIANAIVKLSPDVVSLNEVPYYFKAYYYDDVPALLESLLEQKTGRTWYRKFINVYAARTSGGTWGYGNVIFSRYPFTSSSTKMLSYERGVVQVGVSMNGRTVNIFSTHVDYYHPSYRTTQINQAKSWISGFSSPRIVMGDFNTSPGTSDYNLMSSVYADAWAVGKSAGKATTYKSTDGTHGGSRFDYVFYSKASALDLKSVNVPDTRVNGVYPSDHDPVVTVFAVN